MAPILTLSEFRFSDIILRFLSDKDRKRVSLVMFPASMKKALVKRRDVIDPLPEIQVLIKAGFLAYVPAWNLDSMVQVKCAGDSVPTYAQGRTCFGSETANSLVFKSQKVRRSKSETTIVTTLKNQKGLACEHIVRWRKGDDALIFSLKVTNRGGKTVLLENVPSFTLNNLSPFAPDDAANRLVMHRLRCRWSGEGKIDSQTIEKLHLEKSWLGHGIVSERFGQAGSLPLNGFYPFVGLEDTQVGVVWGAHLAWNGSWQMEVVRKEDTLNIMGGIADRELGHWGKELKKGDTFSTPEAFVTCLHGSVDELCQRLTRMVDPAVNRQPKVEQDLPVIFNEWCTSWGKPSHENLTALADRLKGTGVRYLVIDAGWFTHDANTNWGANGDWIPNKDRFPKGLKATCDAIRQRGIIPGLWFEMENATPGSKAYDIKGHYLTRDGHVLNNGKHFWDFRDPWVHEYLGKRVIGLMKECGIGYMKIDYNDTVGIGVDGAESLGEGLRQHVEGVQKFITRIRKELPNLVIESCSSGGHRLDPWTLQQCAMGSFSDAHESCEIPIIGANMHRMILPRQNQIWATLRTTDTDHRIVYSLAAGFLGRLCLSGDYTQLNAEQHARVQEAVEFYAEVAPVIKSGISYRHGMEPTSYRYPTGWQAVMRVSTSGRQALAVIHNFARPFPGHVSIPLPTGKGWKINASFHSQKQAPVIKAGHLTIPLEGEWRGLVVELVR